MTSERPAEAGEVVGSYVLEEVIGRGSMGCVYRARVLASGEPIALKVMALDLAATPGFRQRFVHEVAVTRGLRHPNIVEVYDLVATDAPARLACAMELIDGPPLGRVVRAEPLSLAEAVVVMRQVIDALRVVHGRGIVHRDLKPSNLLLVAERPEVFDLAPCVKIVDFGIAKVLEGGTLKTQPGAVLGTPRYLAPEQVTGEPVTTATDVYALGEILFEMLVGRRLFDGDRSDLVRAKVFGPLPSLEMLTARQHGNRLCDLVRACLSESRSRPKLDDLDAALRALEGARAGAAQASAGPLNALLSAKEATPGEGERPSPTVAAEDSLPEARVIPVDSDDLCELPKPQGDAPTSPGGAGAKAEGGPPRPALRPWRIGRYTVFEPIGSYGLCESFVARRDGEVALCRLRRLSHVLVHDEIAIARFDRECRLARHLSHPNIARVLGSGVEDGTYCIAQELVLGVSVARLLELLACAGQDLPIEIFTPIALGILDGLEHAHHALGPAGAPLGIVHRDLTPSGVTVSFVGQVKIQDFGAAKASIGDFRTSPGIAVGSLGYMSPEQARGEDLDARSDVYAAACVFHEMLSGRPVVAPGDLATMLRRIVEDTPPPLQRLRPGLDPDLIHAIEEGLAKDRRSRPATAAVFRERLWRTLSGRNRASSEELGAFVRRAAAQEERDAVALMTRVRAAGDALARASTSRGPVAGIDGATERLASISPRTESEALSPTPLKDTASSRSPELVPEDQVSVVTAPGEPVMPTRAIDRRRRHPKAALLGLGAVAALVGVAVFFVVIPHEPRATKASSPRETSNEASNQASNEELRARSAPVVSAPAAKSPVPSEIVAPPRPLDGPDDSATRTEGSMPAIEDGFSVPVDGARVFRPPRPSRSERKSDRIRASARSGASASTREGDREVLPFEAVRTQLRSLALSPSDTRLFDVVLLALREASKEASLEVQRRVKTDLEAAERTYDVGLLDQALTKLTVDWRRRRLARENSDP